MRFSHLFVFLSIFLLWASAPSMANFFSWGDKAEERLEKVERPAVVGLPETVAAPALPHDRPQQAVVVVIIDDMGVDIKRSARAIALPPGVTLSFLPYARHLVDQVEKAKQGHHYLMLHLPMQPISPRENPGPNALTVDANAETLKDRIQKNLESFDDYIAVNNHMGSRFTQDESGMQLVMQALKKRHLIFVDSKTSPSSVAQKAARKEHVPMVSRDVFLDHVDDAAHVEKSLAQTEKIALKQGYAIAIGHPKDNTLNALEKWLPGLEAKGIKIVSVTSLIGRHDY